MSSLSPYNVGLWLTAETGWRHRIVATTQTMLSPLLQVIARKYIANIDTSLLPAAPQKTNYVLYANHQSGWDAIIISMAMPRTWRKQLIPIRFLTANEHYYKNRLQRIVLYMFGGYPAKPNKHAEGYGLEHSYRLLKKGHTIMIFPEGRRTARRSKAHNGVVALASMPNTELLPVKVNWFMQGRAKRVKVSFGTPFAGNVKATAESLMDHVYEL